MNVKSYVLCRHIIPFVIALIVLLVLTPSRYALAYRPFVSTDATVAEIGELEVELGLFNISHDEGITFSF